MTTPLRMPGMQRSEPTPFGAGDAQYDQDCSVESFYTFHRVGWPLGLICVPCWASECALKSICCLMRGQTGIL